jgi:hypothetical protein
MTSATIRTDEVVIRLDECTSFIKVGKFAVGEDDYALQ